MKKYIENLFLVLFTFLVFTACSDEQGTDVGNDSQPKVTLYNYGAPPPADSDNDLILRVAANNKTESAYYFVESKQMKETRGMSDAEYAEFVAANGTLISGINGESVADVIVAGLYGDQVISVAAVGGGKKTLSSIEFTGLAWEEVAAGTYNFGSYSQRAMAGCPESKEVVLLVCTTDANLYKIKDLYGAGYSLKFTKNGETGKHSSGETVEFVRVPNTNTPYLSTNYTGDVSQVYFRDMAYGYNNDAYATHLSYGCYMFPDNSLYFTFRYANSAKNLTWDNDEFIPAS